MSIASEINRIRQARDSIREKLVELGVCRTGDNITAISGKLSEVKNHVRVAQKLDVNTTIYEIPTGYHDGYGMVGIELEEKTVTSGQGATVVEPSEGRLLSRVTVEPASVMPSGVFDGAVYPWITLNDTEIAVRQYQNGAGLEGAKTVILPDVTTINGAGFMNCAEVECFDIGPNIQTINTMSFNGCNKLTKLIIRGLITTKPSMSGSPLSTNTYGNIYVPDEYLEDYKSNDNWSLLADRIKPISEL